MTKTSNQKNLTKGLAQIPKGQKGKKGKTDRQKWNSLHHLPERDFRDIVDMMSAWCYFIKSSSSLTEEGRKALFKQSEVFKMAESALKDLSVDSSVRLLEKFREKWVHDQVTDLEYAVQKGRQEGMEKGREEGMEKGMEKGREEGRQEERQQVVANMLKKQADIAFISEVTGLSQDEINKLKNSS